MIYQQFHWAFTLASGVIVQYTLELDSITVYLLNIIIIFVVDVVVFIIIHDRRLITCAQRTNHGREFCYKYDWNCCLIFLTENILRHKKVGFIIFNYCKRMHTPYLMCRAGETHFNEEGLAGWVNKQFGLVQLSPKRQGYKTSTKNTN